MIVDGWALAPVGFVLRHRAAGKVILWLLSRCCVEIGPFETIKDRIRRLTRAVFGAVF